jgi:hypothetical protein
MDHEKIVQATEATRETGAVHRQGASRRRFLKGTSLALPAVMTLHSVSAQAQAASSAFCANDVDATAASHLTIDQDSYFRNKVEVFSKIIEDGNGGFESNGEATYFLGSVGGSAKWRMVNTGAIIADEDIRFVNAPANMNVLRVVPIQTVPVDVFPQQFAIVHFDNQSGAVISVGAPLGEVNLGTAMVTSLTGACLHSLWGRTV